MVQNSPSQLFVWEIGAISYLNELIFIVNTNNFASTYRYSILMFDTESTTSVILNRINKASCVVLYKNRYFGTEQRRVSELLIPFLTKRYNKVMDTKGPITYTFDCFDYLEWTTEIIAPLLETTAPQLWRIWKVKIRNTKDLHCRGTWKALIWNWGLFQAPTEARSEKYGIRENTVIYQIFNSSEVFNWEAIAAKFLRTSKDWQNNKFLLSITFSISWVV